MPTLTQVVVAFLAAGCLTTGFRAWRWQRREMARINEYRDRLKLRIERGDEDLGYMLARSSATLGMAVAELSRVHERRLRQVEGDALLGQMTELLVVKNGTA